MTNYFNNDIIDRLAKKPVREKERGRKMEQEENILGKEKIGKLIRKFSIPCIISMLVNSLYNIVDQIFIGQGVGYLGNGATNVVFPLVMIGLAFSLMFGDGASDSAYISLWKRANILKRMEITRKTSSS